MDCSRPGSSVHGMPRTWMRILEWVAISFSKGSSQPRDQTWVSSVSCTDTWILYHRATWEAPRPLRILIKNKSQPFSTNSMAVDFILLPSWTLHIYSFFRSTCSTTGYNFKDQRNTTNSITLTPTSQDMDSATLDDQKLPKDHHMQETKRVYFSGQCRSTFDWRKTQIYFKQ